MRRQFSSPVWDFNIFTYNARVCLKINPYILVNAGKIDLVDAVQSIRAGFKIELNNFIDRLKLKLLKGTKMIDHE